MKVIDIHTHAFPDEIAALAIRKLQDKAHIHPFTNGTRQNLASSMRAAGIGLSVLQPVATSPRQVVHINDAAMRSNERWRETGILSFGAMHPDFEGWREELARVARAGLKGIKLHPPYQGVDSDDPRNLRVLNRAGELGLIVLIHAGWDPGFPGGAQALPAKILRAIRSAGPATLILGHMGGWRCWDEAEDLLGGTGTYIDTSSALGAMTPSGDGHYRTEELTLLDEEAFLRILRRWGADRVLFGSDSPWRGQDESLQSINALPLTEAEREAVLHGNAARLLGVS